MKLSKKCVDKDITLVKPQRELYESSVETIIVIIIEDALIVHYIFVQKSGNDFRTIETFRNKHWTIM